MKQLSFLCAGMIAFASLSTPAFADGTPYRLNFGDSVSVTVVEHPELSLAAQPIRPDGRIALPLIQDFVIQGKTVPEATDALAKAYYGFLSHPQIVVGVSKFRPLKVTVLGQVNHPGTFSFEEPPTIANALANAGGLTKRAVRSSIKVVDTSGTTSSYDLDRLLTAPSGSPSLPEGAVIEVGEIWGPDLDQAILLFTSLVGSTVILLRRW